ncbi:Kef-type K+ transport system membrane component KefB [Clostridium tetanomorphum]|uniref:cation:proton antiporter n=1 Tax=Clostridium tetanomorphum TaxID=1553 RepID=UPI00045011AC|nr:cation:proton antiporter [Clostridium tetanomorphum]KAJ49883.1 Na(+)/H(+) antiporter [Clostridium tetanomorphum DSM 665]MBP1866504.1 Kef-type K+ transport system membrane component KefB [Clostridium tetanomorphum]NRS84169.1 Kef-type K+ transport system membrane component KefB [Clostridium tetanomorphum]SQB92616.1 Na(+)/H(+) antiporter [Clostridium tetanomorphum]
MESLDFVLDLAIILLSTKALGVFTKRFQIPQVVGALLAGLILGPALLGIVHESEFIADISKLGVMLLMFGAGLETDLNELKKCGKASFVIAVIGVILPLLGGFLVASFYNNSGSLFGGDLLKILENVFIGVILTATSVSITVETLQEMGKLKTPSGTAILGAAIIDDILGIIILTIVTSMANPSVHLSLVLLKILAFFVFAAVVGYIFYKFLGRMCYVQGNKRRIPIIALSFCLIMSYVAEHYFGVADITGAYIAGLVISRTCSKEYIEEKTGIVSYMLLSPVFFANIGINTTIEHMNMPMIMFTVILLAVAILTKVIGCRLGARACGYTREESLQIGVGMISRGEVALIVANMGVSSGILENKFFAPIILVVIITTLITPILLKMVYNNKSEDFNCLEKAS